MRKAIGIAAAKSILREPRFTPKEIAARKMIGDVCTKTVLRKIASGELSPIIRNAQRGIGSIEVPQSTIDAYNAKRVVKTGGRRA